MTELTFAAILAGLVAIFGLLTRLSERITNRQLGAILAERTPEPRVTHSAGPWGASGAEWAYMTTPATVRRYDRLRAEAGAGTLPAPGAGPVAIEIEHRQPHRTPDLRADVGVPLTQAVATAFVVGFLVGVLGYAGGRSDALKLAAVAFALTLAVSWLWRLGVVTSLLQVVEVITRHELTGDDHLGGPPEDDGHALLVNPGQAREKAHRAERHRAQAEKLADLLTFWRACNVNGTAERSHGIRPGTPAQDAFRAKRDLLMRLGLARWANEANHNAGWKLTTSENEAVEILRDHVRNLT